MKPFIIWTMQRTGGTNFASHLISLSKLPATEHEPLNVGRSYGHIEKKWEINKDTDELNNAVDRFLGIGFAFKHCVEMVDQKVNYYLCNNSLKHDYNHIVLYRINPLNRLLSLHFAQQTGLWGRKKVIEAREGLGGDLHNKFSIDRLNINSLIEHEERCNQCMLSVVELLRERNASVHFISFEDLYESSSEKVLENLSRIMTAVGFKNPDTIQSAFQSLIVSGDQGSKSLYKSIPGRIELEEKLRNTNGLRERILLRFPGSII